MSTDEERAKSYQKMVADVQKECTNVMYVQPLGSVETHAKHIDFAGREYYPDKRTGPFGNSSYWQGYEVSEDVYNHKTKAHYGSVTFSTNRGRLDPPSYVPSEHMKEFWRKHGWKKFSPNVFYLSEGKESKMFIYLYKVFMLASDNKLVMTRDGHIVAPTSDKAELAVALLLPAATKLEDVQIYVEELMDYEFEEDDE